MAFLFDVMFLLRSGINFINSLQFTSRPVSFASTAPVDERKMLLINRQASERLRQSHGQVEVEAEANAMLKRKRNWFEL